MLSVPGIQRVSAVSVLANMVLLSALFPYVSPFPIASMDVQPTAVVIAIVSLAFLAVIAPSRITVRRPDLVVFGIGILILLYVNFAVVSPNYVWVRDCGVVLFAFPVYFAVRNFYRYMSAWLLPAVAGVYLLVLVAQAAAPSLYLHTVAKLLPDVRVGGTGGLNGLAPEPSYIGDLSTLFCVSLYFFHREFWIRHRAAAWSVIAFSGALIFFSQSATGVALSVIVGLAAGLASRRPLKMKVAWLCAVALVFTVVAPILARTGARGGLFLSSVANSPSAAVNDLSFIMRFGVPLLSVTALPIAPFGTGLLALQPRLLDTTLNSAAILAVWPNPELRNALLEWVTYRDEGSSFGFAVQRMGIFSLFALLALLSLVRGFRERWVVRIFLMACILNTSLFIPTIWFVLGCCAAGIGKGAAPPVGRSDALIGAPEAS